MDDQWCPSGTSVSVELVLVCDRQAQSTQAQCNHTILWPAVISKRAYYSKIKAITQTSPPFNQHVIHHTGSALSEQ